VTQNRAGEGNLRNPLLVQQMHNRHELKASRGTDMRYMVTGADGFIASHLVDGLISLGHEVVAFVRYHSRQELRNIQPLFGKTELIWGDCVSTDTLRQVKGPLDGIFHLAAAIDVAWSLKLAPEGRCGESSMDYYYINNVIGSRNVLDFAARLNCRCLLMSSSEVYGTPETAPIREDWPMNPQSPYALSKVAMERLGAMQANTGYDVVIARPFNTYGPRQTCRSVIAKMCEARSHYDEACAAESICLEMGRTDTIRDWVYVADTVDGLVKIMEKGRRGEVYNLGTGRRTTVADACKIAGVTPIRDESIDRSGNEVLLLQADAGKARSALGWEPHVTLEDGMRRTISWWQEEDKS
jgi:nucleoside-diphosphate-sugar epimerase